MEKQGLEVEVRSLIERAEKVRRAIHHARVILVESGALAQTEENGSRLPVDFEALRYLDEILEEAGAP